MENLKRIREPLAWLMVVVAALALAFEIAQLWWQLSEYSYTVTSDGSPLGFVGWLTSLRQIDYSLLVAVVVAVVGCAVAPAVPRARLIATVSAWVATAMVALPWIVGVIAALQPSESTDVYISWDLWMGFSALYPLINTALGVAAVIALWALARPPRDDAQDETEGEPIAADSPAELSADEPEDEHPTTWKPSEATGTVWRTADEAASGAPGTHALAPPPAAATHASEWAERPTEAVRHDDWQPPPTA